MSFYACKFSFNEVSCEAYDLEMYSIGSTSAGEVSFASTPGIVEETIGKNWKPYFYGVQFKNKLSFSLVFGLNEERLDAGKFLTRTEIHNISTWLTGYTEYKVLTIDQEDMSDYYYKCMISGLEVIGSYGEQYAFKANVICDSPYAYYDAAETKENINGSSRIEIYNSSALHMPIYPKIIIENNNDDNLTIVNTRESVDGDDSTAPVFALNDISSNIKTIIIDCSTCVIQTYDVDNNPVSANLYNDISAMHWPRLYSGSNVFIITGECDIKVKCTFPVNIGA